MCTSEDLQKELLLNLSHVHAGSYALAPWIVLRSRGSSYTLTRGAIEPHRIYGEDKILHNSRYSSNAQAFA